MRDELAAELRRLRAASGMSLRQLEREIHASSSSLSRYLSGRTVPPWPVVEQLCRVGGGAPEQVRPLWDRTKNGDMRTESGAAEIPEPEPRSHRWLWAFAGGLAAGIAVCLVGVLVPAVRAALGFSFEEVPANPFYRIVFLHRDEDASFRSVWMKTGPCPTDGRHRTVTDLPADARLAATSYVVDEAACPLSVFLDPGGEGLGLVLTADRRVHDLDSRAYARVSSLVAYDHG